MDKQTSKVKMQEKPSKKKIWIFLNLPFQNLRSSNLQVQQTPKVTLLILRTKWIPQWVWLIRSSDNTKDIFIGTINKGKCKQNNKWIQLCLMVNDFQRELIKVDCHKIDSYQYQPLRSFVQQTKQSLGAKKNSEDETHFVL